MSERERRGGTGTIAQVRPAVKTERKLKRPPLYKVLLHNDDYTTKEFVVEVLKHIFRRSEVEAVAIMMHVHNHGVGVAGVYTHEVAEAKMAEATSAAEDAEFPLLVTIEPEEQAS